MLFLLTGIFAVVHAQGSTLERVSVASDGTQGNGDSFFPPSISADGRYVAFRSDATNLVADDTNGSWDVFVHDRQTHETTRVSVSSNGVQGNFNSTTPSISADGRYVAFTSSATNFDPRDYNGFSDIYVRDRVTNRTILASFGYNGTGSDGSSYNPSISADGRYIAFESYASNLVPNDTNTCPYNYNGNCFDVFVYDQQTNQISRVSISSSGVQGNGDAVSPVISGNGRYVAFAADSTNLISGDVNGLTDLFVRDRQTHQTKRIAQNVPDGLAFSSDGRYLVFGGAAGGGQVYVYDQQTGQYDLVSISSLGVPANAVSGVSVDISDDGDIVAFRSDASNLVPNDNNFVCLIVTLNDNCPDIFVHNRLTGETTRISVADDGTETNHYSFGLSMSAEGRYVAFESFANNLIPNDTNNAGDIFLRDRGPVPSTAPDSLAPADGALTNNATLSWDSMPTAISYHIQIGTNTSFVNPMVDDMTGSNVYPANLPDGLYYWRVKGLNNIGGGPWSAIQSVSFDTVPPLKPTLSAPGNGITTSQTRPTLSWKTSSGAVSYELLLETNNPPAMTVQDANQTTYTPSEFLAFGTYYWQVRARDAAGNASSWSGPYHFTVESAPNAAPERNYSSAMPVLTWNRVSGVIQYEVQVDDDSDFGSPEFPSPGVTFSADTLSVSPTLPEGIYYWHVRARASNGVWGLWSATQQFTVDLP